MLKQDWAIFTKKHEPHISTAQTSTSTIGRRSDYNCEIEEVTNNNCATATTATHLVLVNYSYRDKEMSCCLLLVLLLPFLLMEVDGESTCTEGFMDLNLIQYNMKHPAGSLSGNTLAEEGNATRWIISNKFECTATLGEILIGVDIRTVNDAIGRNLYPKFEIWSRNNSDHKYYTRQMSVDIILTPDNFTTNGLYRYRLPQLVNVSNDYRMGVYQPPSERSVVRFYKITDEPDLKKVGKIEPGHIHRNDIKIEGYGKHIDEQQLNILLHPVTGIIMQQITNYILINRLF